MASRISPAPAPRAADGKPDLSGIWQLEPRPCDASECQTDYAPAAEFINFGAKLPGGLPYQPWAATLVKERTEQLGKDDPVGLCRPGGALRILTFPPFRKLLQMPGLFVILSERDVTYRQIFMDGRPLPDDPTPTFNGYSSRTMGWRHARRDEQRISRWDVARSERQSDE